MTSHPNRHECRHPLWEARGSGPAPLLGSRTWRTWLLLALLVFGLGLTPRGLDAASGPVEFVTYGMPHEAVWGPVFDAFCKKYNCTHVDTDMSSAEAITKFVAEKNRPVAYATEAGRAFGPVAVKRGAALPFKNANWAKLPDWAKDPEGHWFAVYAGVPTFLVNPKLVQSVPESWQDLLTGEYKRTFAMKDPRTSGTALATVLAANAAMGGTLTNLAPGVAFFKKLKEAGNLNPVKVSDSNIQKGEIPITVKYDHENLVLRERLKAEMKLEIVVPKDGTIYAPSVVILNRYAPRPELARAFADFVISDEGQFVLANAFPRPIRYIAGNLAVPADVKARWLPDELYTGRVRSMPDWDQFSETDFIGRWTKEVAP